MPIINVPAQIININSTVNVAQTAISLSIPAESINISTSGNNQIFNISSSGVNTVINIANSTIAISQNATTNTYAYTINTNGVLANVSLPFTKYFLSFGTLGAGGYDGTIKISGNTIVNGAGAVLHLRGFNVEGLGSYDVATNQNLASIANGSWAYSGFNYNGNARNGEGDVPPVTMYSTFGINIVRCPISQAAWLGQNCAQTVYFSISSGVTGGTNTTFTMAQQWYWNTGTFPIFVANNFVGNANMTNGATNGTFVGAATAANTAQTASVWSNIGWINTDPAGTYRSEVLSYIDSLAAANVYSIFDLHYTAPDCTVNGYNGGAPFHVTPQTDTGSFFNNNSITFWQSAAPYLASRPYVIADLYNEPTFYGKNTGGNSKANTSSNDWYYWKNGGVMLDFPNGNGQVNYSWYAPGMQAVLTAFRNAGGNSVPVMLGGVEYSSEVLTGFGGGTGWLANLPTDNVANGLICSMHVYSSGTYNAASTNVYANSYAVGYNVNTSMTQILTNNYPIIIGECGGVSNLVSAAVPAPASSQTEPFVSSVVALVDKFNAATPGSVGITFWSADPFTPVQPNWQMYKYNAANTADQTIYVTQPYGNVVQTWLTGNGRSQGSA